MCPIVKLELQEQMDLSRSTLQPILCLRIPGYNSFKPKFAISTVQNLDYLQFDIFSDLTLFQNSSPLPCAIH